MLSREDVISCFIYILGRLPENEAVIEHHRNFSSIAELRILCMAMPEFVTKMQFNLAGRHIHSPPIRVDVDGEQRTIDAIVESTGRAWTSLGVSDPHYSVLTVEAFKAANIAETEESFYESGTEEVRKIISCFRRNGENLSAVKTAIDFGCGLGRISLKMAERVDHVIGVDISKNHLNIAKDRARKIGCKNVDFVHASSIESLRSLEVSELVYSLIVLQHNAPPVIKRIIEVLCSRVKSGGYIYFQVPTYLTNYEFKIETYQTHQDRIFEMHVIPQKEVFSILQLAGFSIIEAMEDGCTTDPHFISTTFFAKRS